MIPATPPPKSSSSGRLPKQVENQAEFIHDSDMGGMVEIKTSEGVVLVPIDTIFEFVGSVAKSERAKQAHQRDAQFRAEQRKMLLRGIHDAVNKLFGATSMANELRLPDSAACLEAALEAASYALGIVSHMDRMMARQEYEQLAETPLEPPSTMIHGHHRDDTLLARVREGLHKAVEQGEDSRTKE
jgi:hypothetical protein